MTGIEQLCLVTILALLEYSVFGVMVGRARDKYGIEAPATTGNPEFERYFRVHQNTLESLIVFVPAVWMFALMWNNTRLAVMLGLIFILGRLLYAVGYIRNPASRAPGMIITMLVNATLIIGSLIPFLRNLF
jgi:glutathione S-transferase